MTETAPVSIVIPVYDPNLDFLDRTLTSLETQTTPPREVIIVDSSPDPLRPSKDAVFDLHVIHEPELGIGAARWRGLRSAEQPIVGHFDEDAALVSPDYIERAVDRLQDPDVSCVGGMTQPIRGNLDGWAFSLAQRANPSQLGTHNILHPKAICDGHSRCFVPGRGEDITIREVLLQHGDMERLSIVAEKDTPTARQQDFSTIVIASMVGGIGSAAGTVLFKELERRFLP